MKVKQWFSYFAVLCSILLLAACGSNSGSGGDQSAGNGDQQVDEETGISYVGAETCIGCHEDFSWSAEEVADYLAGAHVIHSDHISQADAADGCLDCHDPLGDGPGLESLIDSANVPADGLAAVGCENCHGAGGEHYGVGPIPVASPDYNACGSCHEVLPDSHQTYHPEAFNITSDYVNGGHFTEEDSHNSDVCSKCHTDEGARLYVDVDNVERLETVVLAVDSPSHPIQCRTCHNAHSGGLLEEAVAASSRNGTPAKSAEYATCTNCHQAHDAEIGTSVYQLAGSTSTDGASADGDLIYHATRWNRIIASTHYDDPSTSYESSLLDPSDPEYAPNIIEGYAIDTNNERACRDCHNVHAADTTINEQWALSGHGGEIMEAKELAADSETDRTIEEVIAVTAAGADDSNAFPHYDWDASNHEDCQECHTATGFKNYATAPDTYDSANNDFSHLAGWEVDSEGVVTSSGQNELLYCWGCHSDNAGGLRASGENTMPYSYDGLAVVIPDVGNSNTCIHCHGGRNNVVNEMDDSRSSSFEGHHGPAAGTLFSSVTHLGYEFDGQSYDNPSYFKHDTIGTVDVDGNEVWEGTGTSGPCAACHMPDSDHTFAVVEEDETSGEITITSFETCAACHNTTDPTGSHYFDATVLEEEKAGFEDAITLLGAYVTNVLTNTLNVDLTADSPTPDPDDATAFLPYYETVAIDYYGTYQNYKYMGDEPGAYAHNRYYAKRLIFDSIDLLDNGVLDGTININATTYPEAAVWLGAATVADDTVTPPVAVGDASRP